MPRGPMLSLAALTVLPCSPIEQIEAAHAAGLDAVGLRLVAVMDTDIDVMADRELRRAIDRKLAQTGIKVFDVEVYRIGSQTDIGEMEDTLRYAGDIGAQCFTITPLPSDEYRGEQGPRSFARIAEFCEMAARYGLRPSLEFMKFRGIPTLEDVQRVVRGVGHENLGICLDALHLFRSGGTVAQVAALDNSLLCCLQLCDAPAQVPADIAAEGRYDRLYPGDGDFPLVALLAAIPSDLPISLEAPSRSRAHLSVAERTQEIATKARRLLEARSKAVSNQNASGVAASKAPLV